MENQHKKIKGYRDLSQDEVDLMNRIKEHGETFGEMLKELSDLRTENSASTHKAIAAGMHPALTFSQLGDSATAAGLAEDHLKTGVMWLVHAVALPNSF